MTDFSQIFFREIEGKKDDDKKDTENILKNNPIKKIKKDAKKEIPEILPVDKKNNEKRQKRKEQFSILSREAIRPLWLSPLEAAKLGGVDKKTLKRAISKDLVKYRIIDNRYQVELRSVVLFMYGRKKLWNKLRENGIGQYIEKWVE